MFIDISVLNDPKIMTMNKKLALSVAPTGVFFTKVHNPNQPLTLDDIAREAIAGYHKGARIFHAHARDEKGNPTRDGKTVVKLMKTVLQECPDFVTCNCVIAHPTATGVEMMKPFVEPLLEADPKYIQTVVIQPFTAAVKIDAPRVVTKEILQEMIIYLQERNIVPEFQIHSFASIKNVEEWLIKPGILRKPYVINLIVGYHGPGFASASQPDPWGHIDLFTRLATIPIKEDIVIGACMGGRNWLPLAVSAMMSGVDTLRIGLEDAVWMYPFSDEPAKFSGEMVRKMRVIGEELGRPLASAEDIRKLYGIRNF